MNGGMAVGALQAGAEEVSVVLKMLTVTITLNPCPSNGCIHEGDLSRAVTPRHAAVIPLEGEAEGLYPDSGRQVQCRCQLPCLPASCTACMVLRNKQRQFSLSRHFVTAEVEEECVGQQARFGSHPAGGGQTEKQLVQPQGRKPGKSSGLPRWPPYGPAVWTSGVSGSADSSAVPKPPWL